MSRDGAITAAGAFVGSLLAAATTLIAVQLGVVGNEEQSRNQYLRAERTEAYADFYRKAEDTYRGRYRDIASGRVAPTGEWYQYYTTQRDDLRRSFGVVDIVGSDKASEAAQAAWQAIDQYIDSKNNDSARDITNLIYEFRQAAKADLTSIGGD